MSENRDTGQGGPSSYRQFGKYLLLEKIGAGGMAEIFKAIVRGAGDFQKVVVIKRILLNYSRDPSFVSMFRDEANITSPLQHANIVSIFEFDHVDGQYYLVMELVNGRDLRKVMARANKLERSIPEDIALYIVGEVCKALWYAYNARDAYGNPLKIIHRDVSPSNILISFNGEVKVTDFGVAKAATSSVKEQGGVLKGKLGYMSPEQVIHGQVDHRSDIFSLGIILFEALTLKRLFLGKSDLQTLMNIRAADLESRLARHPELSETVKKLLRSALAKDPDKRYHSAEDFLNDIQDWFFANNVRVGQSKLASFMKDLFPQESDQDILPLDSEETNSPPVVPPPVLPVQQPVGTKPPAFERQDTLDSSLRSAMYHVKDLKGRVIGPVSFDNLVGLVRSRSVLEDESCSVNDSSWIRIGEVSAIRNQIDVLTVTDSGRRSLLTEGNIVQQDTLALMFDICVAKRLTGVLSLKQGVTLKEIYFREGRPKFIFSNLQSELLGEYLASKRPGSSDSVLPVAVHELAETLSGLFCQRFEQVFEWESGWYGFYENVEIPRAAVLHDLDPMVAITGGVRKYYKLDFLKSWAAGSLDRGLVRASNPKIQLDELRLLPRELRIVNLIETNPSISSLLRVTTNHEDVYRIIHLLIGTGIYHFGGVFRNA